MSSNKNNKEVKFTETDDLENLAINDFELKDVSFDVDVKPNNESTTSAVNIEGNNDKLQDISETQTFRDDMQNDAPLTDGMNSSISSRDTNDYNSNIDVENNNHDQIQLILMIVIQMKV